MSVYMYVRMYVKHFHLAFPTVKTCSGWFTINLTQHQRALTNTREPPKDNIGKNIQNGPLCELFEESDIFLLPYTSIFVALHTDGQTLQTQWYLPAYAETQ